METFSNAIIGIVDQLSPSIVRVDARRGYALSGLAWSEDLIVTTNRAVENDSIHIGLEDGSSTEASLIGRDPRVDLAVLRVNSKLKPAKQLETNGLKVGQILLRMGRPRDMIRVTMGVLSMLEPEWRSHSGGRFERLIATDAATFRGFSGGPLVTLAGKVVGLSSAALNRSGDAIIPLGTIEGTVKDLLEHGRIRKPYLGISGQSATLPPEVSETLKQRSGLLILSVETDSPAARAKLVMGDTILSFNDEPVYHPASLQAQLDETLVGKTVNMKILRGGQLQTITATIGERS
jgi:S1-C subfamily serine protease